MATRTDRTRTAATQPYRTTAAAHRAARSIRTSAGQVLTVVPIREVLSPRTLHLLAALQDALTAQARRQETRTHAATGSLDDSHHRDTDR